MFKEHKHILYLYLNGYLEAIPQKVRNDLSRSGFLRRCFRILRFFFHRIGQLFRKRYEEDLGEKTWVFINSKNSFRALEFLDKGLEESKLVYADYMGKDNSPIINTSRQVLYFHKWIWIMSCYLLQSPRQFFAYFDLLSMAVGLQEAFEYKLRKYKPKAVILSNDHAIQPRSLMLAAKKLRIPVIYLQHASITRFYPPLESDLALLEGEDALRKYEKIGPVHARVAYIGMPRMDAFILRRNQSENVRHLGVCCNTLDEETHIIEVINKIRQEVPELKISFRKHPADQRNFNEIAKISDTKVSDPEVHVMDFLSEQDMIISGNSSIHLEATILNVSSLFFHFSDDPSLKDYYGYVSSGMIKHPGNLENLIQEIKAQVNKKENTYLKAKKYNALVGTEDEGKSAELAIQKIRAFLEN